MCTVTIVSEITYRKTVDAPFQLCRCKTHNKIPVLQEVYTGNKRKKFQGVVAVCLSNECSCYSYTVEDVSKKWNEVNHNINS